MPDTPPAVSPGARAATDTRRPSADDLRRRYEAILQSAGEGILALDEGGAVIHANAAAATLLGWDQRDLVGRSHHELVHHTRADGRPYPVAECPIAAGLKEVPLRSGPDEVFWRRDGASLAVEYVATPLWENGRLIGTVVQFRDATERRRGEARAVQVARDNAARSQVQAARRALERSEEWLHVALQAGHLGAWEWDLATGRVSWSPTLERIHGLAEGAFAGTFDAAIALVHPDDRECLQAGVRRTLDDHVPHHSHYRIVLPDRQVRWLEAHGRLLLDEEGRPARMVGVCQDITQRKEAERALKFQKALLEAQREALPDGLLLVSSEGRILSHNRRFVDMWGLDDDIMRTGSDAEALRVAVQRVADPDAFITRVKELYASQSDGAYDVIAMRDGRVFERFSRRVRGEDGTYFGYVWFFRDATGRLPAP